MNRGCWIALTALTLFPLSAFAGEPVTEDPRIFGGQNAQTCAWPTVVAVTTGGGLCTGTLVHPSVVVYAAHCGANSQTRVRFGERSSGNPLTVTPQRCEANPDYNVVSDQDVDWAYCLLDAPIDIPVTPMMLGCAYETMPPGTQVAIVGYGNNQTGGSDGFGAGTKRWALASLVGVNEEDNVVQVSELGEPAICSGDSGGPALHRMPDGSWHAFGITSTGPANSGCTSDAGRLHSLMAGAAPWVEERVGFDITPCTDPDGTWNPNAECGNFFSTEPGGAFGSWSDGCLGGPTSPLSGLCGPAFGEEPDVTPPEITLNSPVWGDMFPVGAEVLIDSTVTDNQSAIKGVRIEINGEDIGILDTTVPFSFPAAFGEAGQYEIVAVAHDWSGNIGRSNAALIAIGDTDPIPPDPTTGTSGGGTDGSGTTDGWTPGMDGGPGSGKGCQCGVGEDGGAGLLGFFALFAFAGRRRRH